MINLHDLKHQIETSTPLVSAQAFAPSNIALCKYWGKRDTALNLPLTDSLSISLGDLGATTSVEVCSDKDHYYLNGQRQTANSPFFLRLHSFLDLFRSKKTPHFKVESTLNIPYAAGLASSACGFAAITEAINKLLQLELSKETLSQISRLGSGSASRSHWHGFVQWHAGHSHDGRDCFATPINEIMPSMRLGLILTTQASKLISSRQAMQQCFPNESSRHQWQLLTREIMEKLQIAIQQKNWATLGQAAQMHAHAMHQLIEKHCGRIYHNEVTNDIKKTLLGLQQDGLHVFWTQDAGPQMKLLFEAKHQSILEKHFPAMKAINPWEYHHE